MNKDTRFSPLFKSPNRMKRELRGDETRKAHFFLRIITGFLLLVLIAQIYHHRQWFMNIPKEPLPADTLVKPVDTLKSAEIPKPDTTSAIVSEPEEEKQPSGPGLFNRLFSRLHPEKKVEVDEIIRLDAPFDSMFRSLGLDKSVVRRRKKDTPHPFIEERIPLPKGKPLPEYILAIKRIAESRGLSIADAIESARDSSITIEIWGKESLVRKTTIAYGPYYIPGYARLAFVVEGFGETFNQDISNLFSVIKRPMTLGIVPGGAFTSKIYQLAVQNGYEIICQIPMENIPYKDLGENAIYKRLDNKRIDKILTIFGESMPETKGYSIFGGGIRIVENEPEILKMVLAHIKAEDKYFIDNSFASRSRVEEIASITGLRVIEPLGFVDIGTDTLKEKEAVLKYANIARKTGKGIIFLKESPTVGKVLEQTIPIIESYGIKIVTISSLFK